MPDLTQIFKIINKAKAFGYQEPNDRTRLYGSTPHIAPEAWLHKVFGGLKEEEIKELEQKLSTRIPESYNKFLLNFNGMTLFSCSLSLDGYRKTYSRTGGAIWQPFDLYIPNVLERQIDAKGSYFYIGGYNWDGSLVYIDSETSHVHRCSSVSSYPLNTWANFNEFLLTEVKRLDALFDERGIELDEDTPTTPS